MFMLSLDQIQRELKAIEEFDILFLADAAKGKEETLEQAIGFIMRQARKQELRDFLKAFAARN